MTAFHFKTVLDEIQMEALGKGNLKVKVSTKSSPMLEVSGSLAPRFACDMFDSVLAPGENEDDMKAAGMAWMMVTKNGDFKYNIK